MSKPLLLYALHCGNLYGTERVALATAAGLKDHFDPIILAPAGAALEESARLGLGVRPFKGMKQLAKALWPLMARGARPVTFLATSTKQSLIAIAVSRLRLNKVRHVHIVHGGTDEHGAYGNKKKLNHLGVQFITVSDYARQRLIAHGTRADRIEVIPNFLTQLQIDTSPRRGRFISDGVRNVVMVVRADPLKRVDLMLDALDLRPDLASLSVRIYGSGADQGMLARRAAERNPNVTFVGFHPDIASVLPEADLFVHCCPVETFGLAILEAMNANLPVLVPNAGGAGLLVKDNETGFHFAPDDAADLANKLAALLQAPAARLQAVVDNARKVVDETYSPGAALAKYRSVLGA